MAAASTPPTPDESPQGLTDPSPPNPFVAVPGVYDDSARLSELLLRPLDEKDLELRHFYQQDIRQRLQHAPPLQPGQTTKEEAAAWLAARPIPTASPRGWRKRRYLLAVTLLFALAMFAFEIYSFLPVLANQRMMPEAIQAAGRKQLYRTTANPVDNPLRDGPDAWLRNAEASWRAHPDDVVRYHFYVTASLFYDNALPENYQEVWKRLDPDNAYWLLLEALNPATPLALPSKSSRAPSRSKEEILQEAARLPRCHSYRIETWAFLDSMTPGPPETYVQVATEANYWRQMNRMMSGEYSWYWVPLSEDIRKMSSIAPADQGKVSGWLVDLIQEAASVRTRQDKLATRESLFHAALVMGQRQYIIIFQLLIALLAGVLCLRLLPRRSAPARMALCTGQLLDARRLRGWLLIGALLPGVFIPVLLFSMADRFSYRNPSDGILATSFLLPNIVLLASIFLMAEIIRHHVSSRTALLGLGSGGFSRRFGVVLGVLCLVPLIPLLGSSSLSGLNVALIVFLAVDGLILLWLGLRFLLGYFSPSANIRHRLIAGILVPAVVLLSLSLGIAGVALHPVESALVKKALTEALEP